MCKVTQRRLMTLAAEFETGGTIAPPPRPKIKPGSRLVREWHGRTHAVCVTDVGFEFQGKIQPPDRNAPWTIASAPASIASRFRAKVNADPLDDGDGEPARISDAR